MNKNENKKLKRAENFDHRSEFEQKPNFVNLIFHGGRHDLVFHLARG